MKIVRTSKCSLKFTTQKKKSELVNILSEYGKVVNLFIDHFWELKEPPSKANLLKPIVDVPKEQTWLSARLRKVAAREALDMILAVRERWKSKPENISKPLHRGKRMYCSSTIAELQESDSIFDCFLKIGSVGEKKKLLLPIKKHKQFNKWAEQGKRLNSYIITNEYVQFVFEVDTGPKKEEGLVIGIDTGIKQLATTSDGEFYGEKIEEIINTINRCQHGSVRQKRLRNYLRHYIDTACKQIFKENPRLQRVVVERLKNMNFKTKQNKKLGRKMRKSIGAWNYAYWLGRVEAACEENRVRFTSINPAYTSQKCRKCGHTSRANRQTQDVFKCTSCNHTDHADCNAAKNILDRGVSLVYRRGK